jgi:hypothetical protein
MLHLNRGLAHGRGKSANRRLPKGKISLEPGVEIGL